MTQFLDEKLNSHQTSTLSKAEQLYILSTTNSDLLVSAIYPNSWMNNQRDFKTLPLLISYFNPSISLWFSFWLTSSSAQGLLEVLNCIKVCPLGRGNNKQGENLTSFSLKLSDVRRLTCENTLKISLNLKKQWKEIWYSLMIPVVNDKGGAGRVEIVLVFQLSRF